MEYLRKEISKLSSLLVIIIVVVIIVCVSIFSPYLIALSRECVIIAFRKYSQPIDIPIQNYVATVTSVLSFLVATILSSVVYSMNRSKIRNERRQAIYEIFSYFSNSVNIIENYNGNVRGALNLEAPKDANKNLFISGLPKKKIDMLNKYLQKVKLIWAAEDKNNDNVNELCNSFAKQYDYNGYSAPFFTL